MMGGADHLAPIEHIKSVGVSKMARRKAIVRVVAVAAGEDGTISETAREGPMLKPVTLTKLNRIAGMFGSDHAGERAAAALAAHRLVTGLGLTWWDVLTGAGPRPAHQVVMRAHEIGIDHAHAAESRVRQLRAENEALQREVKILRNRLNDRAAQERKARQQDDWREADA
ncbi:hypothetical protein GCM10011321_03620 [Youhaiella tibetensis]|nr:hypothetical protein GCM10011321_03620 [Youhaiella tibetensis]